MGIKFIKDLLDKISDYLPDEEPATEMERNYEEGKKRIFEMHQTEKDIFYVEQAWIEKSEGKLYGEIAKGKFYKGDKVILLDVQGNRLLEGEILACKEDPESEKDPNRAEKKFYLTFEEAKLFKEEDFFVRSYYVIKKH